MITLTRFVKLDKENVKAVADIIINGGIKIHGIFLFTNNKQEYFIKFPEDKKTIEGIDKYYPIIEVDDIILKGEIYKAILAEYQR